MRKFPLMLLAFICLLPSGGLAQEQPRVLILPFEVHAREDLSYLRNEIPSIIRSQLKLEGANLPEPEIASDTEWRKSAAATEEIRKLGIENGVDYVIWGSLTRIGQKFSLDAKMLQTFGEEPAAVFYAAGEGIENLLGSVTELTRDIALKLFKRERITRVAVTGNKRIETDAILRIIKTKPGDMFQPSRLNEDLKAIYAMGYFEDIRVETDTAPDGRGVTFNVLEKPTIRSIRLKGNRVYGDKEILDALTVKSGSILNVAQINSSLKRVEDLYKEKNYHNIKVQHTISPLDQNQADLQLTIEEGGKLRIKSITFEGNAAYTDKQLKKQMKTSEKGFFYWLSSSGELNRENLSQDVAQLAAFYQNSGYILAKIGEPRIDFRETWIEVTLKIDEGPRYKVGKVDLAGDLVLPRDALMKGVKVSGGAFYSREAVRNDVLSLTDMYSDEGYAYTDISPQIDRDNEKLTVDITYNIRRGKQVYFEKILISGNSKTRDKVIRRELQVYEEELYSGKRLKKGVRNLYRLDYFEDIKVDTQKGSADDRMILNLEVTEKPTGALSFGGGYSSVEKFFVMGSVSQRNLFGRGQTLQLRAELGGVSNRFTVSFTEPWLFDIPLSAGVDIYNWDRDYDTYDRESQGFNLRFSYPVWTDTRLYFTYLFDIGEIRDIQEDAPFSIKELSGTHVTSSVSTALRYDTRDRIFNPTEGQDHSISVQYAGLGGDIAFTKYIAEVGWYFPLFWNTVGFLHGRGGYVLEGSNGKLPDYERFYLGGMNSLRGFAWRDISLFDEAGNQIGGEKFVQFNAEFIFPILKDAGLIGVLFYDRGDVYSKNQGIDLGDLRHSAGFGFRWYSPIGPIRLENGYIIDPKPGERTGGRWEFSMGTAF